MLVNILSLKSRKGDQKQDSQRSEASLSEIRRSKRRARPGQDCSSPSARESKSSEGRGLGVEGWLGLMVFLGIVLGLVYARLTLP